MANPEIKKVYHFELRNAQGNELGTDAAGEMTEAEAFAYAKKWMEEIVDCGLEGNHLLIVDPETDEVPYQGDFGYCGYFDGAPIKKTPNALRAEETARFDAEMCAA